jgi:release factor glutamine methyltransferase
VRRLRGSSQLVAVPSDGLATMTKSTSDETQGTPWQAFYDEARARLEAEGEDLAEVDARRIVEEASGSERGEFILMLDQPAMKRGVAHFDSMLERRLAGEPLQYVLGRWGFRTLDLAVDARVLIPRPETEGVAELALAEVVRAAAEGREPLAADLGTGSGCIGLSLAAEHKTVQVVCTDQSVPAVAAARANAIGLGRPATRIEVRHGSWFEALPVDRKGAFDVIVSNPPYIGTGEVLPAVVADWEPTDALFAGPTGLEDAQVLIAGAADWLRSGGALVLELGETQLDAARDLAVQHGYIEVAVHRDLAERDRALVARKP